MKHKDASQPHSKFSSPGLLIIEDKGPANRKSTISRPEAPQSPEIRVLRAKKESIRVSPQKQGAIKDKLQVNHREEIKKPAPLSLDELIV